MIARLAMWAVDRRLLVAAGVLTLAVAALVLSVRLPLDALPDLTNNQVQVLTAAPGLSPEEVEQTVTRPLEVALSGLAGLREQRSLSRYGISSLTLVFDDAIDPWRARQFVSERLDGAELPNLAGRPALAPLTGGLGEVFQLTLSSDERTPAELLQLATLRVAPLLKSVAGVVEVNSWGGAESTLDVVADPVGMAARGVTFSELSEGVRRAVGIASAGALPTARGQALLRAQSLPETPADLAAAVIQGPQVRVADIADVRQGKKLRLGAATANGGGETVYLMAQMLRDTNALELLDAIHARMPEVHRALPSDVRLEVIYDRSVLVRSTLRTVAANLLEGGALVVLVLLAFLGSWRAGLVAASVIPLAMAFATAVMSLAGLPGNLMSLGALDFGLLVDGAIVLVEGVFHSAPRTASATAWVGHVRKVAGRSSRPVFFSVLVILLVYVPVLAMQGTDGKLFRPMALTVVLALGFALMLSLTWVPAMLALVLRAHHVPARDPWIVRVVDRFYPPLLERLLGRRLAVALCTCGLLAAGAWGLHTRGVEFTPQLDEGDMVVQTTLHPDVSLERSIEEATQLERALLEDVPEVRRAVSRIGSPAVATDIMGLEQADVFVGLAPRSQWRAGLTREGLVEEMAAAIARRTSPEMELGFTQPIQMRFNELLGGAVTDVAVSLYGEDLAELRRLADALADAFRSVEGAADVRVLAPPSVPVLTVRPRPLEAGRLGLAPREVLELTQAARAGVEVGQTWRGPLRIPLRVVVDSPPRAEELAAMRVPLPGGGSVPLSHVAEVSEGSAAGLVNRRNGQRRVVIGMNVRGADLGAVVAGARRVAAERVELPPGYRLEWGGQYESLTQASEQLRVLVPIVMAIILVVLVVTFGGVRPALAVFTVVPVAAVGGVLTLALRDMPVSLPAAVGFIALSGIAVMNGVVWMARALELRSESADSVEVARQAARERVRPVLMTALVAALGFVPMMLSTGVGAEVQRPLATVVVGGLVTSTLLTLAVLPTLFPWFVGAGRR